MEMSFKLVVLLTIFGSVVGKACEDGYFECGNGQCIPEEYLCDGDADCPDGRDEREENCPVCDENEFTCASGQCIPVEYICDNDEDCNDWSDEIDPVTGDCPSCPATAYDCQNKARCLPRGWTCDGSNDCGDWSDETLEACPCGEEDLRCATTPGGPEGIPGACIPPEWICDPEEIWDCPKGEDEINCNRSATSHDRASPKKPVIGPMPGIARQGK